MAKFISSTNLGMEKLMPKDVYAKISFGEVIKWRLDYVKCFETSMIERFTWDKETKRLQVFTLNSFYEFELETDTFNPYSIKCAGKEKIAHFRYLHETALHNVFCVRILTTDEQYFEEVYTVHMPLSFYDAKALLVGKEYNQNGLQGKILHVFSPMRIDF